MEHQIVVFDLLQEHFGVDIAAVESIIKMQTITRMPESPVFVEGITNLRGKVVPVIDLHKRFSLPLWKETKGSRIVIVTIQDTEVGMIVDGVSEVLTISDSSIEPPPAIATTINSSFITGIAKLEDKLIILLDLKKVLSSEEQYELKDIPSITQ